MPDKNGPFDPQEYFDYLDGLRESGATNMFGGTR